MSKFKVKDKVIVIGRNTNFFQYKVGKVINVDYTRLWPYRVKFKNGDIDIFEEHELELATPASIILFGAKE